VFVIPFVRAFIKSFIIMNQCPLILLIYLIVKIFASREFSNQNFLFLNCRFNLFYKFVDYNIVDMHVQHCRVILFLYFLAVEQFHNIHKARSIPIQEKRYGKINRQALLLCKSCQPETEDGG